MKSNEFSKRLVKSFDIEEIEDGLRINGATYFPEEIDYSDDYSVKVLATKAVETANGFYHLIKKNCNTSSASSAFSKAHLEMYLALAGFACEIFMKGIIYFENRHGGKKYKGHKLDELFEQIPAVHKEVIKKDIEDIENALPIVGNAFEVLRYDYELAHIEGSYLVLFDLMEDLKAICDSYPKMQVGQIRSVNDVLAFE